MIGQALAIDLHTDRLQQKGHVAGDNFDNRMLRLPAVIFQGRIVNMDFLLIGLSP